MKMDIPPIDDTIVNPQDEQQAREVLEAEQQLLVKLLQEANAAVAAAPSDWTRDWLIKYWRNPLSEHKDVTTTWINGIDLTGANSPTRAAAHVELDAVAKIRTLVKDYIDSFSTLNDQTTEAFQNWTNDFTLEVQAKRALIRALR
jgi:hypothetical protein